MSKYQPKIREILTYPNPILRDVSKPVKVFDQNLQNLVQDMFATMYDANGIGLAAIQVGEPINLLILDTRPKDEKTQRYKYDEMTELEQAVMQPLVLINPVIVQGQGKTTFDEGCLSVPSFFETVERFDIIEVKAFNEKGEALHFKVDGLLAICIQHEMDHLDGKLFIDRISFMKSNKIKNQIKKNGYPTKEEMQEAREKIKEERKNEERKYKVKTQV